MLKIFIPVAVVGMALSGAAVAQSSSNSSTHPGSQAATSSGSATSSGLQSQASGTNQPNNVITVDKLKQELQSAGFSDVNVVADAFVVQAKSKDGNPVVMMIGPHGVTAFEAIRSQGSSAQTGSTGSTGSATSGSQHK